MPSLIFRLIRTCALLLVLVSPVPAFAQDSPKAGLVMGYPAAISLIWHVDERVALRPEIALTRGSSSASLGKATQTILNPGVSALFYTATWDTVRSYISPRYVYRRATSSQTSPFGSSESTGTAHSVVGSVGAEFTPHRRFGVFGEVGLDFTRASNDDGSATSRIWTARSAVGAILYF